MIKRKTHNGPTAAMRCRLPSRRAGFRLVIGGGKDAVHMATGEYDDGKLGEIFLDHQREGTFGRAMLNAFAMSVSLGLQHGVPLSAFTHAFRDFKMEPDMVTEIFKALEDHYGTP